VVVMNRTIFWDIMLCSPFAYYLLHAGFFFGLLCNPEDGGDMFL
jgi:hypothetical protein